jgi:dienelactone hydrolase
MNAALVPWGRALLLCGLAWAVQAWGQTAVAPQAAASAPAALEVQLALDLREELVRTPVTVKDLYGRQETRAMPVTIYRPAGEGPYPLVVFNHGRAVSDKRAQQGRYRPEAAARYLVAKGFVVLVPTRVGYWENYGDFDPEATGSCNSTRPEAAAQAMFDQVMATVALAKTLPYVDASRWIVAGQSAGGAASVVTVGRAPEGLIAGLNFAGGGGGNPESSPGHPCSPQALERLWGSLAQTARAPMLWLYWPNDKYWGPDIPKSWHKAWLQGGGQAQLPGFEASPGSDGHHGLDEDMDHWLPVVDAFLGGLGFAAPAIATRPAPSGFADVNDVAKVPVRPNNVQAYQRWLGQKLPRAFAVSERGGYGSANGDYALGRALGNCRRYGGKCQLYAVDNDVVWAGK